MDSAQDGDLAPFLGDLSQSEILTKIKSLLQYNMAVPDSCDKCYQTSGCLLPFIEHVEAYVQNTKNWSIASLALLSISCASILCTIVFVFIDSIHNKDDS